MHAGVGSRHTHNNLTYTFWTSYLMCLNGCGLDDFSHTLKWLLSCIPVAMLTTALLCKDVARPCHKAADPPSGGEANEEARHTGRGHQGDGKNDVNMQAGPGETEHNEFGGTLHMHMHASTYSCPSMQPWALPKNKKVNLFPLVACMKTRAAAFASAATCLLKVMHLRTLQIRHKHM